MKKGCILFIQCIFFYLYSLAQTSKIDSLRKIIYLKDKNDPSVVLNLCSYYHSLSSDSLYHYIELANNKIKKNITSIRKIDYLLSVYYKKTNNNSKSLEICNNYLNDPIFLNEKNQLEDSLYFQFSLLKASIHIRNQEYKDAISLMFQLIPKIEKTNDIESLIQAENFIGYAHMEMNDYRLAINYFKKAISISEQKSYTSKIGGMIYSNLAAEYSNLKKTDSAFIYINKSIEFNATIEDLEGLANAYFIKADIFKDLKKDYKKAENNMLQGVAIRKKIGDNYYIVSDLADLADFFAEINQPQKGISIAKQALEIAIKYNIFSKFQLIYTSLAKNYKINKDYLLYAETLEILMALKDSVLQNNPTKDLKELQSKYEIKEKEHIILEQDYKLIKRNYLIYSLLFLFSLLTLIFWGINKNKKKNEKIERQKLRIENDKKLNSAIIAAKEEERKVIIADLHDDIGADISSINLISNLIYKYGDLSQEVKEFSLRISNITKELSERMNTIFWVLKNENDTIENLISFIEKYGKNYFENSNFQFVIKKSDHDYKLFNINSIKRKNIFLSVKESLNNSLKHSKATLVTIDFNLINDNIFSIKIYDNGIGLPDLRTYGNGLNNIERRMNEINGSFNIYNNNGAEINLFISLDEHVI